MEDSERKEAQNAINKLIQDSLKEVRLESSQPTNYSVAYDTIESLKKFQEIGHKSSSTRAMWISVVIAIAGLLFTALLTFGGTRITMQNFFKDVEQLQISVKEIKKELEYVDRLNKNNSVYIYKVDKLIDDVDKLKRNYKN